MATAPTPLASAQTAKTSFTKAPVPITSGVKKGPAKKRGFKLDEDTADCVKLMLFGTAGSGKTYPVGPLVEKGNRVAIISTDFGDSGHLTVKNYLLGAQHRELLKNVCVIPLDGYSEVANFLREPWKHDIGDGQTLESFDPTILMWDGFSAFQQIDISTYVGDMSPANEKPRGEFRESGLVLEMSDWGAIRNATLRKINEFLALRKPNGGTLDKIVTITEATQSKEKDPGNKMAGTVIVTESFKPLLSGAGGVLLLGCFDVIGRTKVKVSKADATKGERIYTVVFAGSENTVAKNRGFDLKAEEPANWDHIWDVLKSGATEKPIVQTEVGEVGE